MLIKWPKTLEVLGVFSVLLGFGGFFYWAFLVVFFFFICFKLMTVSVYHCLAFSAFTLPPYVMRPELQDITLPLTFSSLLIQQGLDREGTPGQKLPGFSSGLWWQC